jgi:hypothetical protein
LYAKQSYTGGTGCSFPYSYVEPYPAFYNRLKQFAGNAGAFFSQLSSENPSLRNIVEFFPRFSGVMEKLAILAEKQLAGSMFSKDENEWLKTMLFNSGMSGTPPYDGWYQDLFFDPWDASKGDFTMVDVHTQPTDESGNLVGKVLHTGVGRVNLGIFVTGTTDNSGKQMAYVGPVMSYYELITENFKRMNDQEWTNMIQKNQCPLRPDWTHIYLAGAKGEIQTKGAELPSVYYTDVTGIPVSDPGIKVYPNPVRDKLTLSFRQDKNTSGKMNVYNSAGTLIRQITDLNFPVGFNSRTIDFTGLQEGLYLLQVTLKGQNPEVFKIIKK